MLPNVLELSDWVLPLLPYSDERIRKLDQAFSQPAPLDLRVNALKAKRADILSLLPESWGAVVTPYAPSGLRISGKLALQKHPLFLDGTLEVQDESSQLAALLLGAHRGEMVLDFCAGAGGKTLAIGAMMHSKGRLYAWDVLDHRLDALRQRVKRSGLSNVQVERIHDEYDVKTKRLHGKLDRVLVDAPCSGLGTLRRNPDLRFRQGPESLLELRAKQISILKAASLFTKPGGRLVYATCSILPCENEEIIQEFLNDEAGQDYVILPVHALLKQANIPLEMGDTLNLYPDQHQTDGFFACVLEKKSKT
jgi:16S rRNA (cytosine967-C5)-methyltransferase